MESTIRVLLTQQNLDLMTQNQIIPRRPWKIETTHQGVATHSLRTTVIAVCNARACNSFKSCNNFLQRRITGLDNDGVQKQRSPLFIWTENASVQTKNCVAALSMMASIVLGSSVRQVRPALSYWIKFIEVCISLEGRTKYSGGPHAARGW